jgi:hypothetical protein
VADTFTPTPDAPATETELSIERIEPYLTPAKQRELIAAGLCISRFGAVTLAVCDICASPHPTWQCPHAADLNADAYAYRAMVR